MQQNQQLRKSDVREDLSSSVLDLAVKEDAIQLQAARSGRHVLKERACRSSMRNDDAVALLERLNSVNSSICIPASLLLFLDAC